MLPQEIFSEIRYSEIVSEAILKQKQSRSSNMARRVLNPIFGCHACMHLHAKPADFDVSLREGKAGGVIPLSRQLVN